MCDLNARGGRDSVKTADVLSSLGVSDETGLSAARVRRFRVRYGANELPKTTPPSFLDLLAESFEDFTLQVLLASGVLSLLLWYSVDNAQGKGWIDGVAILLAVAVVVLVQASTNFQRDRQFRVLSAAENSIKVKVRREGTEQLIDIGDLVVGDIHVFGAGDVLPADGLLLQGFDVRVDESHLTGESEGVAKGSGQEEVLFSGSPVLSGYGRMLVLAVGAASQAGKILVLVQSEASDGASSDGGDGTTSASPNGSSSANGQQPAAPAESGSVLSNKLEDLAEQIGRVGLGASLAALAIQVLSTLGTASWSLEYVRELNEFLLNSITILVVAVPEGLPLAVTVALAFSVRRMLADNNLVRYLNACETMATCTSICSDKTGTLTLNALRVVRAWVAGCTVPSVPSVPDDELLTAPATSGQLVPPQLAPLPPQTLAVVRACLAVNSTATFRLSPDGGVVEDGNRTETALLRFACLLDADIAALRQGAQPVAALPFSSERKRMSVLVRARDMDAAGAGPTESGAEFQLLCKGAAEVVMARCDRRLQPDGSLAPLAASEHQHILRGCHGQALRLLAIARRDVTAQELHGDGEARATDEPQLREELEEGLVLLGVFGIADRIREEVPGAVEQCMQAGVAVRMLTGDQAATAASIARQCGILPHDLEDQAAMRAEMLMSGDEFRARVYRPSGSLDQEVFNELWPKLRVLSRCSPQDKYTIIQGCQAFRLPGNRRDIVAMTGDGTNDAPALRLSDVGFAMVSGTSIARQASDILLMDDNFRSIVQSIKWGRNVYTSIIKFLQFQLTVNVVAVVLAVGGVAVLAAPPLSPVQMLWVNMIMDSLASLALATEAPTDDMLRLQPFASTTPLLSPTLIKHMIGQAAYQLVVMVWVLYDNGATLGLTPDQQVCFVFNTFVILQLANQVACRKVFDEANILDRVTENPWFVGVLSAEVLLQVLIVQFGHEAFATVPLPAHLWFVSLGFGMLGWIWRQMLLLFPTKRFDHEIVGDESTTA